MTNPKVHEEICKLLKSTDKIFKSLTEKDYKRLSLREEPPETPADKYIGTYLTKKLAKIVPGHSIIAEDSDPILIHPNISTWFIDPIDGTIPFIYKIPSYTVSIYETNKGKIKSAYAYNPNNGQLFFSNRSKSYCNNQIIKVSEHSSLVEARVALSGHVMEVMPDLYKELRKAGAYVIFQEGLIFRSTLVATGVIDATLQLGLRKYESGTVYGLVTKAGGCVKSVSSSNIKFLETTPNVIITNHALGEDLFSLLKNFLSKTKQHE